MKKQKSVREKNCKLRAWKLKSTREKKLIFFFPDLKNKWKNTYTPYSNDFLGAIYILRHIEIQDFDPHPFPPRNTPSYLTDAPPPNITSYLG